MPRRINKHKRKRKNQKGGKSHNSQHIQQPQKQSPHKLPKERRMVAFDGQMIIATPTALIHLIPSQRIQAIIPYPDLIGSIQISSCCYDNDNGVSHIYIIRGDRPNIIKFDMETKVFEIMAVPYEPFGNHSNSYMRNDQLFILNGESNDGHIIQFDLAKGTFDKHVDPRGSFVRQTVVVKNEVAIRVGGYNLKTRKWWDKMSIGQMFDESHNTYNKWVICEHNLYATVESAYIYFKPYIIRIAGVREPQKKPVNEIYFTNLKEILSGNRKMKWIKSEMKSPITGACVAIIRENHSISIWSQPNDDCWFDHHPIHVQQILGDFYGDNVQLTEENMLRLNRQIHDLEEKNEDLQAKYERRDKSIMRMKRVINEYKKQIRKLESSQKMLREKVVEHELTVERLKRSNKVWEFQCGQIEASLTASQQEVKEMKRQLKGYRNWSGEEVVSWICKLDNGQYMKYKDKLSVAFSKEGVIGSNMHHLDKSELQSFGVDSFCDRGNICDHINRLVNRKEEIKPNELSQKEGQNDTNMH